MNNTDENEIGDSGTDHTGVKENSLNSPNTTKNVTDSKNSDEESDRSSPEVEQREECEEYEIVDTSNGEYACEQPGARIVLSESDSREELVIPSVNEEPGAFWHATVSPGKRHLIQVMVGTPRASLSWKFSTEKKVKTCVAHWLFLGLVSCRIAPWDYFGDVAFFYWLSRRWKGSGSKFDPQNSPIMQFESTPTQSISCDRCLVPSAWWCGFTSHGGVNFKISLCNQMVTREREIIRIWTKRA